LLGEDIQVGSRKKCWKLHKLGMEGKIGGSSFGGALICLKVKKWKSVTNGGGFAVVLERGDKS